jgi:HAD superfamily hydrolase (TIGR01509 family)
LGNQIFTSAGAGTTAGDGSSWPRAAVFDCDGLLVDSAACWHRAYATLAAERGRTLAELDLAALAGASVGDAAKRLGEDLGAPFDPESLRRLLLRTFAATPPRPLPGAVELITALAARGPVGVASNAPAALVEGVLADLDLRRMVRTVVSAERVGSAKPAPDVYLEACRRLAVGPSDAIAFEDSPPGAAAARAAGLFVVAVPSDADLEIDADLTIGRLDDPRLLRYLQLDPSPASG